MTIFGYLQERDTTGTFLQQMAITVFMDWTPTMNELYNVSNKDLKTHSDVSLPLMDTSQQNAQAAYALLNSLTTSALLLAVDGTVVALNAAAAKGFDKEPAELIGTCFYDHLGEHLRLSRKSWVDEVVRSGELQQYNEEVEGKTFGNSLYPVTDKQGNVTHIAVYTADISHRKKTEAELKTLNEILEIRNQTLDDSRRAAIKLMEQAKQAKKDLAVANQQLKDSAEHSKLLAKEALEGSRAKSEFLANMSHEIRTPLNAIVGFSEILKQGEFSTEEQKYTNAIYNAGQNMLVLIEDILDFSKIEAGKIDPEIINCSLEQFIGEIESMMTPLAAKKGLEFSVIMHRPVPSFIRTDPVRLRQCLVNLINNAIKFTASGYINLEISSDKSAEKTAVRFDVVDTGIGIANEKHETIFEAFSQADNSTTRRHGGTGLGLAITKKLVEILGGNISLVSKPGKGSTFTIIVPDSCEGNERQVSIDASEATAVSDPTSSASTDLTGRILVAEDNPSNQMLICIILKKIGLEPIRAKNGQEVMEFVKDDSCDLILMDMQMPIMNGYKATRALRDAGCEIPIIALTANAMKDDRAKCLEAGCDEYLSKPINQFKLKKLLQDYLPCKASAESKESFEDDSVIISDLADDEDLKIVVEVFTGRLEEMMTHITSAIEGGDTEELKRRIHELKGAGGSAGYPIIFDRAAAIEELIGSEQLDSIDPAIKELEHICTRILATQKV